MRFDLIRHIREVGDSLPQLARAAARSCKDVGENAKGTKKQHGLSGARCLVEM